MQKRRKYSREYKQEAVRLTKEPGVSVAQIARDLGINGGLLGKWCKQADIEGTGAFVGKGHARDEEMAALKRELARVRKERDFLKDAAAFFARELK
jgi:transposase